MNTGKARCWDTRIISSTAVFSSSFFPPSSSPLLGSNVLDFNDLCPSLKLDIVCYVSLVEDATSIIFVMTNACLSWQNMFFVRTHACLLRQKFCHDKHIFVTTKLLMHQIFVATNISLSWQAYFCQWQAYFCHDKSMIVVTKLLLQQT